MRYVHKRLSKNHNWIEYTENKLKALQSKCKWKSNTVAIKLKETNEKGRLKNPNKNIRITKQYS